MKNLLTSAAVIGATATAASAGNLDRSFQSITPLFEDGSYAELSFGFVSPDVSGTDVGIGANSGNVGEDFIQFGAAYKRDITEQLSFALILDEPFGADVRYPSTAAGGSVLLGGTRAELDTLALTGLLRYEFANRFSVHGGLRLQQLSGAVDLSGLAFGGLDGYSVEFADDTAAGFVLGAAYEIPDIALRVSLTYNSEIDHTPSTTENFAPGVVSSTDIMTPESWNLEFQTGIAEDTLLFGGFRWVNYSEVSVIPATFGAVTAPGTSLVNIDDTRFFTLGVGRRFTDKFSGSVSVRYEPSGSPLVSPLGPTDGSFGITLGGRYEIAENVMLSGGINYTRLGDATPITAGTVRANFQDNESIGVGFRLGYSF